MLRLEYPVAAPRDGYLVGGFIDLVSAGPDDLAVIDFKTDRWPRNISEVADAFPAYVKQVGVYSEIIEAHRAGLLFAGTDQLAWIDLKFA